MCEMKLVLLGRCVVNYCGNVIIVHRTCRSYFAFQVLRKLVKKVLITAHNTNMTSIAMPAIGTGNLGIPPALVASLMFGEAEDFSRNNPTTTLRDIRFVVYPGDKATCDVSEFCFEC